MAEIFLEEFGDMLVTAPVEESNLDVSIVDNNDLPSPEQLRGKIILKVKDINILNTYMLKKTIRFN